MKVPFSSLLITLLLLLLTPLLFLLLLVVFLSPLGINIWISKQIETPKNEPVELVWTQQNWTPEQKEWWYHVSQGSGLDAIIPYQWFISLEQPKLSFFRPASPLIEPNFLAKFGFLRDQKSLDNPDNLPVGFTKTENYFDPQTSQTDTVIGFNCAVCHTGQINYRGKGIRIEGGSGMINLDKFKKAVGFSLLLTDLDPFRFRRFAAQVLGENNNEIAQKELKQKLKFLIANARVNQVRQAHLTKVQEGFARLDALTRIGNFVFGIEFNPENERAIEAPVNFPYLWSTHWFDWVQYNGSVMQPMVRNAGEALGVFSRINLDANYLDVFQSNLNVDNLNKIEQLLGGTSIFTGLVKPKWSEEILGEIDHHLAAQGEELYRQYCQGCHLPSMNTEAFRDPKYWTTLGKDQTLKYLKVTMKNLYTIGTDPKAAENWYQRTVNLGTLAQKYLDPNLLKIERFNTDGVITAGMALPFVVEKAVEKKYDDLRLTPQKREEYNGNRPNLSRAPLAYKARPLNGIWATPPFLHNGAVPNLYEMLIPASKRTQKFYLGTKEFDPKKVGFQTNKIAGGFLLDTTLEGNHNTGHEFRGDGTGSGVIGPELNETQRWAIIEYLKTL